MRAKKYRKRPIVIEAERYRLGLEDGFDTIGVALVNGLDTDKYVQPKVAEFRGVPYIETPEGKHYISNGDYIITGVQGERYPCKEDIFTMTYEEVVEDDK